MIVCDGSMLPESIFMPATSAETRAWRPIVEVPPARNAQAGRLRFAVNTLLTLNVMFLSRCGLNLDYVSSASIALP